MQPTEQRSQTQKARQNEMAEVCILEEGTDKIPEKQLSEVKIGNPSQKNSE